MDLTERLRRHSFLCSEQLTEEGRCDCDIDGRVQAADELDRLSAELARLKQELRDISAALNDPRTDLTLTMAQVAQELRQEAERLRDELRPFPMLNGPPVTWGVARVIYAGYAAMYGTTQSLERIAERGGFGWGEVVSQHYDKRGRPAMDAAARAALAPEQI